MSQPESATAERNLCASVEARVWYSAKPCLPRPRRDGVSMPHAPDYAMVRRHEWSDGNRGRNGGVCLHCHRVRSEVYLRINFRDNVLVPGTTHPHKFLAQMIAEGLVDVPPIMDRIAA